MGDIFPQHGMTYCDSSNFTDLLVWRLVNTTWFLSADKKLDCLIGNTIKMVDVNLIYIDPFNFQFFSDYGKSEKYFVLLSGCKDFIRCRNDIFYKTYANRAAMLHDMDEHNDDLKNFSEDNFDNYYREWQTDNFKYLGLNYSVDRIKDLSDSNKNLIIWKYVKEKQLNVQPIIIIRSYAQ